MLSELFELAVRNMMRARARLLMTSGGVLVGTTAVILLIALTVGLQRSAEAGIGSSGSLTQIMVSQSWMMRSPDDVAPSLDAEALAAIVRIDGIRMVVPFVRLQNNYGMMSDPYIGYGDVLGIDPRYLPYMGFQPVKGEMTIAENQFVAGAMIETSFFDPQATEYAPITIDLLAQPIDLQIGLSDGGVTTQLVQGAGVFSGSPNFDYALFLPIQQVIEMNIASGVASGDDIIYDMILVEADSRETVNDVIEEIRALGYMTSGAGDYVNQLNSFFSGMRLILGGIGGVALLVAAFGVANTMTMAIFERTREIGLMKAIGATDGEVLLIFVFESGLVGLLGGVAGITVSLILQSAINQAVMAWSQAGGDPTGGGGGVVYLPIDLSGVGGSLIVIPSELIIFALVLSTLVGVSAGLYPSIRAARMLTVSALKSD